MRYIDVDDSYVDQILAANKVAKGNLNEGEMPDFIKQKMKNKDDKDDEGKKDKKDDKPCESTELHACPLCESELDEPISEENMQECVDFILGKINEALDLDGDSLEEAEEEVEDGEEEEED